MMLTMLTMTAALAAAGPAEAQDGVVATARATPVVLDAAVQPEAPAVSGAGQAAAPHGLSTDQQIERWLAAREPAAQPFATAPADDRQPHGVFDVGFGTDGYRSYGAAVSLPIGENGRLGLSFRQVENGYPYGYGYGYGDPTLDYPGYAFPGQQPFAPAEFEGRLSRPDGPPGARRPLSQQDSD